MESSQLKLLAGLVRGLLEQRNVLVGHNQSLDLISALPGLRNWPEVLAFPDRVSACQRDTRSAGRLAYRLRTRHEVELSPEQLISALNPPRSSQVEMAPQVWPSGPPPGVYFTTNKIAIDELLASYEEATDGELVYAEQAGSHWDTSIDLGEWGLLSNGLQRVPSGTLVVVGPMEFNQQMWNDVADHLRWACIRALESGHRVAVLVDTPAPALMFNDVDMMVRSIDEDETGLHQALRGVVSDSGELVPRAPFTAPIPTRSSQASSYAQSST